MPLIIDIDSIGDANKKEWLMNTLRLMNIHFNTSEKRQTLEEYNLEISEAEAEIERGEYISAEDLKKEAVSWK
jgi:hypothetical protein